MELEILEKHAHENNKNYIYRVLKYNIMVLKIEPNSKISEADLQKIFNTSRSPIREALVNLEKENLIEVQSQKGTKITAIDFKKVSDTLYMRKIIENDILKIAISLKTNKEQVLHKLKINLEKMKTYKFEMLNSDRGELYKFFLLDNEFHKNIFEFCGRENVWDTLKLNGTHYERLRILEYFEKTNLEFTLKQHAKIIEMIEKNKTDEIDTIGESHMCNFLSIFERMKKLYPDYFEKTNNDRRELC